MTKDLPANLLYKVMSLFAASMKNLFLIKINGQDTTGVTARLTGILASFEATVLDINQEVVHKHLSLGLLVATKNQITDLNILNKIKNEFANDSLDSEVESLSLDDYEQWVLKQGSPRYIVTVLARELTAEHLHLVSQIIASQDLNILEMNRLSGRHSLRKPEKHPRSCLQIEVRGTPKNLTELKNQFLQLSATHPIDLSFQQDNLFRRHRNLVVFDMDSTLIQAEVIDELAKYKGVFDQVSAITESAMRGELDFKQSLTQRLALLKDLDAQVLPEIAGQLKLTQGCERLIGTLKKMGFKTAIISGGFTFFGHYLSQKLGIDEVHANELEIKQGKLTGRVVGSIMDALQKEKTLRSLAQKYQLSMDQTIAIGDGANDIPMIAAAGLGVAFHAKPKVRAGANHSISAMGLDAILYLMGIRDRDIDEI